VTCRNAASLVPGGVPMVARAAIAAPALAPRAPPRRQPRHPGQFSRQFQALESPTTPRCDDRLNSGHHRRFVGSAPLTIRAIRPIERAEIHLIDRPQDRPHHMIIRHPIRQIRRHQHRLPPVTSNEVLSHTQNLLNLPGRHSLPDSHRRKRGWQGAAPGLPIAYARIGSVGRP